MESYIQARIADLRRLQGTPTLEVAQEVLEFCRDDYYDHRDAWRVP